MPICPKKKDPDAFRLVEDLSNDKYAIWLYDIRGESFRGVQHPSIIKSKIGYNKTADTNKISEMRSKVAQYNAENNTSHDVIPGKDGNAVLSLNYMPSKSGIIYEDVKEVPLKSGDGTYIVTSYDVNDKVAKVGKDEYSVKEIKKRYDNNEGDPELVVDDGTDALIRDEFNQSIELSDDEIDAFTSGTENIDIDDIDGEISFDDKEIDNIIDSANDGIDIDPDFFSDHIEEMNSIIESIKELREDISGDTEKLASSAISPESKLKTIINKIKTKASLLAKSNNKTDYEISQELAKNNYKLIKLYKAKRYEAAIKEALHIINDNYIDKFEESFQTYMKDPKTWTPDEYESMRLNMEHAQDLMNVVSDLIYGTKVDGKILTDDAEFMKSFEDIQSILTKSKSMVNNFKDFLLERIGAEEGWSAEDIASMQTSIDGDISFFGRMFSPLRVFKDPILRYAYKKAADANNLAHIKTKDTITGVANSYMEWEKHTKDSPDVFYEKDKDGNLTRYFASPVLIGEYFDALDTMYKKINEIAGQPAHYRHISDEVWETLSKEDKDKIGSLKTKFNDNHTKMSNGRRVPDYKENKAFNKKYRTDKYFKEAYDKIMDQNELNKSMMPAIYQTDRYKMLAPQVHAHSIEIMKKQGWKGFKTLFDTKFMDKYFRYTEMDTEYGDVDAKGFISNLGTSSRVVPVHYTKPLDDVKKLSTDVLSTLANQTYSAFLFSERSKVTPMMTLLLHAASDRSVKQSFLSNKQKEGHDSNAYNALSAFIDANVYGVSNKSIPIQIAGTTISADKVIRGFMSYARTVNLFMNIPSVISGYIKGGIIDTKVDDIIGSYTSQESANRANFLLWRQMPQIGKDFNSRIKKSTVNMLLDRLGVIKDIHDQYYKMDVQNKAGRVDSGELIYGPYSTLDFRVRAKAALSMMMNMKYIDGRFMSKRQFKLEYGKEGLKGKEWKHFTDSIYDMYEYVDGMAKVKDKWRDVLDDQKEAELMQEIQKQTAVYTGMVTKLDRTALGRSAIGATAMMHRNWMVSGFSARWANKEINPITGEETIGFHRGALDVTKRGISSLMHDYAETKSILGAIKLTAGKWDKLEDSHKMALYKTALDAGASVMLFILKQLLDDYLEKEKSKGSADNMTYFLAYQANRTYVEQMAFTSTSFIDVLKSPTPLTNYVVGVNSILNMFDPNKLQNGPFKDMSIWQRDLIKYTLIRNMYMMNHFKEKNQYYKTLVLNAM